MAYLEPTEHDLGRPRHSAEPTEPAALGVETAPAPPPANGRAGRNLPAAITVGASLGALILASLLFWRPAFVFLVAVVLSDTGGYVFGVFFGRHPMAPTVSPKKSWEGTAGSLLVAAIGGALMLYFVFHVPWWHGALFGLGVAAAAVLGDLAESLLKRDLKIKDMSNLLP